MRGSPVAARGLAWGLVALALLPALLPPLAWLDWSLSGGSFAAGWPSAEGWGLFGRSCAFAAAAGALAAGLGVLGALRILSAPTFRKTRTLAALSALLAPPAIHGLAWATVTAQGAAALRALGGPDAVLQGPGAALAVTVVAYGPLATGLALAALLQVDPELLSAGRLFQSEGRTTGRLLLGLAAPHLLLAAALVALLVLQDFTLPALFSMPTYVLGLFARFAAERDPAALLAQALPLLLAAVALSSGLARRLRPAAGHRPGGPTRPLGGLEPFRSRPGAALLADAWLLLPLLAPLLLLLLGWDGPRWAGALRRALPDLVYSLTLGMGASLLAAPAGWILASAAARADRGRTFAAGLFLLLLVLPTILPSLGVLRLLQALPRPMEGLGPLLAALARAIPAAALVCLGAELRRDPGLLEAARLLGRPWAAFWRVRLPLGAPALAVSAVLAFALTLGECAGTILLLPPGRGTVATRLFNLLHYGASADVAALSALLALLALGAALLAAAWVQRAGRWRAVP